MANLVVVAGNRDDIRELDTGPRGVLTEILLLVDTYDLYGKIAIPKHHTADQVSEFYRLTALSKGVFINPALTEPFGLTLIEAAASGLPIVATEDGGPTDIISHCHNGYLIDPLDGAEMAKALLKVLSNLGRWKEMAEKGLKGVARHYSWEAHAEKYVEEIRPLVEHRDELPERPTLHRRRMLYHDRAIFTDLDQNLLGNPESLAEFVQVIRDNRKCATFGIATGRSLESALRVMRRFGIPQPDILITGVGTEIHYAPQLTQDKGWERHIEHLWQPARVKRLMRGLPGIELQPRREQGKFKISYYIDLEKSPCLEEIQSMLHQAELSVNTYLAFGQFLDIIPIRASKGMALRWYANQWGIPLENILAAGGSGADEDMMRGNTLAVVVANRHGEELSHLADTESIYFAKESYARGILEAIEHYDFYGACTLPSEEE
jgi:sucrose-phosphate synthase